MGIVFNYFNETETTFLETSTFAANAANLWTSNGNISVDPVVFQDSYRGSLKLIPSATENFVYFNYFATANGIPSQFAVTTAIDAGDLVDAFVWLKPSKNCTLHLKIILSKVVLDANTSQFSFVNPFDQIVGAESSLTVTYGALDLPQFKLLRAIPVQVPASGRWSIQIQIRAEFDNLQDAVLNISRPTAHQSTRFFLNAFFMQMAIFFPTVFFETDSGNQFGNEPVFAMSRFLDVITTTAMEVYDDVIAFDYIDQSEGGSDNIPATLSTFVNPDVCDTSQLPFLSQFRGRPILLTYQPSTEGVGWIIFTLNQSLLDGTGVLGNDATNFGSLPEGIDSFARWQVREGYYGHNAGTLDSMVSAIKLNLTGQKIVGFTKSLNQIDFTTSQAETFGSVVGDIGASNPVILSLIEPAKPLGMIVTHTMTA